MQHSAAHSWAPQSKSVGGSTRTQDTDVEKPATALKKGKKGGKSEGQKSLFSFFGKK